MSLSFYSPVSAIRRRSNASRGLAALMVTLGLLSADLCPAQIQPCAAGRNCIELEVEGPTTGVERGGTALVALRFRAAESDGAPGGVD
jgi:hypothetical protein